MRQKLNNAWYVAARDRTRDLPFPGADTLPTELSGPVFDMHLSKFWKKSKTEKDITHLHM